jgi:hypothetical protein
MEPEPITVQIAHIAGRGESAGEREVEEEIDKLRSYIPVYWANYDRGLNNFETAMSFASDQETRSRYFDVALKEVGKVLLDEALKAGLGGHPVLGSVAGAIKNVATAWYEEARRVTSARAERRIADYISELRVQAGTSEGPQQRMLRAVNEARPRLLDEYRNAVARSRIQRQGEFGVLTGDAALFIRQVRQGVEQFRKEIPPPARFAQYFAEAFGGSPELTRLPSHGGRTGGSLYIDVDVYFDQTSGTPQWSLKSAASKWTLATTAPQPDRIAPALKTALRQQNKAIWETRLPKMVRLRVEEEVPWGLNRHSSGYVRFVQDPDRFEVRSAYVTDPYGSNVFASAWRVPGIRRKVLDVNELEGSND